MKNIAKIIIIIIIITTVICAIYFYIKRPKNQTNISISEENINNNIIKVKIKENLGLVQEQYKGYKVSAKLEIPKINLETYVLEDYSIEALKVSVTKFWGNNPNEIGNFCIAGHNYREFKKTTNLEIGDTIILTDNYNGVVEYEIYDIFKVLPSQTECLSQYTNGKKEVTLITCTKNSQKRIIIKAKEIV